MLMRIAAKLMLDNGAFSAWMASEKRGAAVVFAATYWRRFYEWVIWVLSRRPDAWFVIPDVINAGTQEQDALLRECPSELLPYGRPVWHMDEPVCRALQLIDRFGRICIGSTSEYRVIGSVDWRLRQDELWNAIISMFGSVPDTHMLRGLQCQLSAFDYPFTGADSTDRARNHNRLNCFGGMKPWAFKQSLDRWHNAHCPATWPPARLGQMELFAAE